MKYFRSLLFVLTFLLVIISVNAITFICYQETANQSAYCGGLANGSYGSYNNWNNLANLSDGNYTTSGRATCYSQSYFYVNYSKPTKTNNSIWQTKDEYRGLINTTIPSSCFSQTILQLRAESWRDCSGYNFDYSRWQCYSGTIWDDVLGYNPAGVDGRSIIYEEAIFWNITQHLTNCSGISDNITTLIVNFKDSITQNPTNVNVILSIEGDDNYYLTQSNKSNISTCVNSNYVNISESIQIQYGVSGIYNYYNFDAYLTNQTQYLTLYFQNTTDITTFTIKDKNTYTLLENVLGTIYKQYSGVWVPIESKYSDLTGRIQFGYFPNTNYKFYLAKSNYESLIFYLSPILFSSYDVSMEKSVISNISQDYDRMALIYAPTSYISGDNNFTFIIQSPYSELKSYGYTITLPNTTTITNTDTNTIGSQLTSTFTIVNASVSDTVTINYFYQTELSGLRNFTFYFPISVELSNNTMISIKDNLYGMALIDRLFITVFTGIFVVGVATILGAGMMGLLMTFILWGFYVYIGLTPVWSVAISIVVGIIYIAFKS